MNHRDILSGRLKSKKDQIEFLELKNSTKKMKNELASLLELNRWREELVIFKIEIWKRCRRKKSQKVNITK